jgi:hypothetical protein
VTTYTITLADGRRAEIVGDEITTRADGSLWVLRAERPPPDKLVPVCVFAARLWRLVAPVGEPIVWDPACDPEPPPKPRLLPAVETPDEISRRPW